MVAIDREEQIRDILAIFEDRLTSPKPESNGSWFELSRMLDGAPPWRAELNRRWASREDWKRFLEWEIDFRAEQWNRDSLPAGRFPKPIRPRAEQAAAGRHVEEKILVEFTPGVRAFAPVVEVLSDEYRVVEWDQPGVGLVRGCAVRTDTHNGCGEFLWAWDGTFEPVEEEQQAAG